MAAIAKRLIAGSFSSAEIDGSAFLGDERQRPKRGLLVGTVAKGLLLAEPARAPRVTFVFFDFHCIGCLLRAFRCIHDSLLDVGKYLTVKRTTVKIRSSRHSIYRHLLNRFYSMPLLLINAGAYSDGNSTSTRKSSRSASFHGTSR